MRPHSYTRPQHTPHDNLSKRVVAQIRSTHTNEQCRKPRECPCGHRECVGKSKVQVSGKVEETASMRRGHSWIRFDVAGFLGASLVDESFESFCQKGSGDCSRYTPQHLRGGVVGAESGGLLYACVCVCVCVCVRAACLSDWFTAGFSR